MGAARSSSLRDVCSAAFAAREWSRGPTAAAAARAAARIFAFFASMLAKPEPWCGLPHASFGSGTSGSARTRRSRSPCASAPCRNAAAWRLACGGVERGAAGGVDRAARGGLREQRSAAVPSTAAAFQQQQHSHQPRTRGALVLGWRHPLHSSATLPLTPPLAAAGPGTADTRGGTHGQLIPQLLALLKRVLTAHLISHIAAHLSVSTSFHVDLAGTSVSRRTTNVLRRVSQLSTRASNPVNAATLLLLLLLLLPRRCCCCCCCCCPFNKNNAKRER